MKSSESIMELAKALCKAQSVMENAKKDADNPFFKSKYADLSSVWEVVRKPLTENGLSIMQFPSTCKEDAMVVVETVLVHISGEWVSDALKLPYLKADPQSLGSAITYGRRYGLSAVIGVVADEDDDGNKASGNTTPPSAPPNKTVPKKAKEEEKVSEAMEAIFVPDKLEFKEYRKKDGSLGTRYFIFDSSGKKYATFSATIYEDAKKAHTEITKMRVTYKTDQYGNNIETAVMEEVDK